jgi:hypothetical protein
LALVSHRATTSELFHFGVQVCGDLQCEAALNVLPLRGAHIEPKAYGLVLELSRLLSAGQSLRLGIERARVVSVRSEGRAARLFEELLALDEAYGAVVEVGIGLRDCARPLESAWPSPANEAVPGVHLGLGADPADPTRFRSGLHFDLMCPDARIEVQGQMFYDGQNFLT